MRWSGSVGTEVGRGRTGCSKGRKARRTGGESGVSSDETDCAESELPAAEDVPSQCLVDRCSSAVCFCAQGLPLGKGTGQRWGCGQLGSVHRPSAPLMQVSTPLTFLCQDLSKAFAAGAIRLGGGGSRLGFSLRTARDSTPAGLGALAAGVPRRWWGRHRRIRRRCTRVRDMQAATRTRCPADRKPLH